MSKVFTITEGLENLGALRTGGQGSVYKGRRTGHIYTAVKLIPTPIYTESAEDKNYRNFLSEVSKLQKVNENPNPNVVKILSWGVTESGSFPFIEMEYIEGPDLCELLQPPHDKVFTLKELIRVADQLAGALAHCHRLGVKHGDIKSNNVKYNIQSGNYVLLDFGLAIMSEEQRRSSIRHAGAIEFMAPEQHEGKMLLETDVYSYGVILYELFAGQVPFPLPGNGDTGRNTVMLGHMESEVPDALALRQSNLPESWSEEKRRQEMQVPAWLPALIGKCLAKKPEDRYPSGTELYEAVISGSLASSGGPDLSALQRENERLKAQLDEYQQLNERTEKQVVSLQVLATKAGIRYNATTGEYEQDTRITHASRAVLTGIMAVAVLSLALFLYALLSDKPATQVAAVQAAGAQPYRSPYIFIKPFNYDSLFEANRRAEEQRKLQEWVNRSIKEDMAGKDGELDKNGKKKKRKKFLGIF